jgi:hypothetical protein
MASKLSIFYKRIVMLRSLSQVRSAWINWILKLQFCCHADTVMPAISCTVIRGMDCAGNPRRRGNYCPQNERLMSPRFFNWKYRIEVGSCTLWAETLTGVEVGRSKISSQWKTGDDFETYSNFSDIESKWSEKLKRRSDVILCLRFFVLSLFLAQTHKRTWTKSWRRRARGRSSLTHEESKVYNIHA